MGSLFVLLPPLLRGEEGKKKLLPMGMLPWILTQQMTPERIPLLLLLLTFLACPEKTTLSILRFLNLDLLVKAKLMEVTMLTLRLNVKHSIFAQLMELEVLPSTASSVLMEHSSTRTISSVIGGSTLTAPLLRIFTLSMMRLQLNVKLLQELLMLPGNMELQLRRSMPLLTILSMKK